MAIALVGTLRAAQADDNPETPTGYNTAGANLLVAVVVDHGSGGGGTPGDNKSNTGWVTLAIPTLANSSRTRICYHTNTPNVGADHRFKFTGAGVYSTVVFGAFSGAHATAPFDQQNGNSVGSGTTVSSGGVTPSEAGCLVIAGTGCDIEDNGILCGSSFQPVPPMGVEKGGVARGGYMAYKIQTTIEGENPVWISTDSNAMTTVLASFKAGSGVVEPPPGQSVIFPRWNSVRR